MSTAAQTDTLSDLDQCTRDPWTGYCEREGGCECQRMDAREYHKMQPGKCAAMLKYYARTKRTNE